MISVVVCTFNRCESLRDTLSRLREQVLKEGLGLEIVVVDNNSSDRTWQVVEEAAKDSPWPMRYVFEKTQGLSHARNRGIREAHGEFVAFTDDDVLPDRGWIQSLREAFVSHGADCAGGKILPMWTRVPPDWCMAEEIRPQLWAILALLDRGEKMLVADTTNGSFLFGANMAFRKRVFEEVGFFNPDLGRSGENILSGDDTEMLRRVLISRKRVVYSPQAIVYHKVPPERLHLGYLRRWKFNVGLTSARIHPQPSRFVPGWLMRECLSNGLGACAAYVRGSRLIGIAKELAFWAQAGRIVATVGPIRKVNKQGVRRDDD